MPDALEAAKEALHAAGKEPGLFPAYFREGGPDSLSAALSKHVRACVSRKKIVPYSLRHRVTARLSPTLGGCPRLCLRLGLGHVLSWI